jgi:hypothetical protein
MTQVVSFVDYTPAARFDGEPWTEVDIEEADTQDGDSVTGDWTVLETIALAPVDADPENPTSRSFTTSLAGDGELWYRLIFRDADDDEQQPTLPVQNIIAGPTYATVNELARTLQIRNPTEAQRDALQRVLSAAAAEINHEINLGDDDALDSDELQLAAQVNLQRAAELWGLQEVPLGLAGIGSEFGTSHLARNSWEKYAFTLAAIKRQYGIA